MPGQGQRKKRRLKTLGRYHFVYPAVAILMGLALILGACQAASTPTPTPPPPTATKAPALAAPAATPAPPPPTQAAAPPAAAATPTPAPPSPTPKPVAKGKVVLVAAAELPNLNPLDYTQDGPQPMVWPSVTEYLVKRDWKTMQIAGLLAEKWEQVKPDTWRYVLRKGIKFQNGEPFNADSVVYSLGVVANKDSGSKHTRYWAAGGKLAKVDEYTVEVTSAATDPIQPLRMIYIPMVPPKWSKENPELRPIQVYGTGPYKFVEWVRGQY